MRTRRLVTASIAMLVLAVAAGAASANKLSFSSQRYRVTWTSLSGVGGGLEVECVVTVEGSFHSATIAKTRGLLIGNITKANVGPCGGAGRIYALNGVEVLLGRTVINTLPWHVKYESFEGTLPRFETVRLNIVGAALLAEIFGFNCLYRSTAARPWSGHFIVNSEGRIIGFTSAENELIPLNEGPLFCPTSISPSGIGGVQVLGQVTSIFIRLI
jgi:hypothetical protein